MYRINKFIFSSCKFYNLLKYSNLSSRNTILFYQIETKNIFLLNYNLFIHKFHTSKPNLAGPPLFWALIRPVLKGVAIVFGKSIRKWWHRLPKHKKKYFIQSFIKNKNIILGCGIGFAAFSYSYYLFHIEEHPITKRKRFLIFNDEQIVKIAELQVAVFADNYKDDIVPIHHPSFKRVKKIVEKLISGNSDLRQVKDKVWSITVINKNLVDAFVFPNGHIVVFSGILNLCRNDDQLGIVIGHEIAHTVLGHSGEKLSNIHFIEMLLIIPLVIIWSIFPDTIALFYQLITSYFLNVQIQLPYSRILEKEADEYGLILAAKCCFDIREAISFWKIMSEADPSNKNFEFLSSHPSHEHRQIILEKQLPIALKIRKLYKCPELR